MNLTNRHVLPF